MRKLLVCFVLLLASYFANANPLFMPVVDKIVIQGKYEYFYTEYGDLIGREDIGVSGSFYLYNDIDDDWDEEGYFISDGEWCKYYDSRTGKYVGKVRAWYEEKKVWESAEGMYNYYTLEIRSYVDAKDRPVATYREQDTKGFLGPSFTEILSNLTGLNTGTTLILDGKIRMY